MSQETVAAESLEAAKQAYGVNVYMKHLRNQLRYLCALALSSAARAWEVLLHSSTSLLQLAVLLSYCTPQTPCSYGPTKGEKNLDVTPSCNNSRQRNHPQAICRRASKHEELELKRRALEVCTAYTGPAMHPKSPCDEPPCRL